MSGENTHYLWFSLPILLFGVSAAHFASMETVAASPLGDSLLLLAGLLLAWLCLSLYRKMTSGR